MNIPTNLYERRQALCSVIVKEIEKREGIVRYSDVAGQWYCEVCNGRGPGHDGSVDVQINHTSGCAYAAYLKNEDWIRNR